MVCDFGSVSLSMIDVKTLAIVLTTGCVISVFLIVTYQLSGYKIIDRKLAGYFIAARALQAIAYALIVLRGYCVDFLSVNIGNSLLIIGFYMEAISMLIIVQEEKKHYKNLVTIIAVIALILFNFFETKYTNTGYRVATASFATFFILIIPTAVVMFSPSSTPFKRIIGIFYCVLLALLLPRAFYALVNSEVVNIYTGYSVQVMTFLSLIMLLICSLSVYLLLMKESSDKVITHMANTDFLTGIMNRHSFLYNAGNDFSKNKNYDSVSILFCDIDFFKKVNDTYGHNFGDIVLKRFAEVLSKQHRSNDIACRYGGEEFVVYVTHADGATSALVANRIMEGVKNLHFEEYPEFTFTISIGVCCGVPKQDDNIDIFINKADKALYHAKKTGRNKVVFYHDVPQEEQ